jgi:hypothetical protein
MILKKKAPEYVGDMIVCFDMNKPLSQVHNGNIIIGNLTQISINTIVNNKAYQINNGVYSLKDMVVPVFVCNSDADKYSLESDWTRNSSPISETNFARFQRWWPRHIFKGSLKINGEPEELLLKFKDYNVRLHVTYAFSKEAKALFSDIVDNDELLDPAPEIDKYIPKTSLSMNDSRDAHSNVPPISSVHKEVKTVMNSTGSRSNKEIHPVSCCKNNKSIISFLVGATIGILGVGLGKFIAQNIIKD